MDVPKSKIMVEPKTFYLLVFNEKTPSEPPQVSMS